MKKKLKCQICEKSDDTVKELNCGYVEELSGKEVKEIICEDCEHEHLMDI